MPTEPIEGKGGIPLPLPTPPLLPDLRNTYRAIRRIAALVGLGTFARMLLITVLPLKALDVLGTPQFVSAAYFVAGCVAVGTSLFIIPAVSRRLHRHFVFGLGLLFLALCLPLLAADAPILFLLGLAVQAIGVVIVEVTTSLYAQDALKRDQFLHYEPIRLFVLGVVSVIGPWAGVYAATRFGPEIPFILSGAIVAALALYFLMARRRLAARAAGVGNRTTNPLVHMREFARQPRMRLAYALAVGRSAWWMVFYIYMPIFAISLGFSPLDAAALVSLSTTWVVAAPLWGKLARHIGTRPVVVGGYLACGLLTIGAGLFQDAPLVAIGFYVAASCTLSMLDGPGNVFFLRAVKPLRRTEMTSVFSTYRDVGQAAPQLLLALVLSFAGLDTALVLIGLATIALGIMARHLPRGL